jgi:hypothetical protein
MLFDELATASRPLSLKDFNLYVFRGLRGEFRDLVKNILLMAKKVSWVYFQSTTI